MHFFKIVLRGVGQIMFQGSALTGAFFVLGIALHSWLLAVATVLGSGLASACAYVLRFPKEEITAGLYGFNGALVALAGVLFYSSTGLGWSVALLGALLATLLMRAMLRLGWTAYTFPFVATVWLAFWLLVPQQPLALAAQNWGSSLLLNGLLQSFGQVMFQANSWSGLAFLLGIALHDRRSALYAAAAAALSLLLAWALAWPAQEWAAGLMGYNAVLAAIAMAGQPRWPAVAAVLAVLLSMALTAAMQFLALPALTFPFILSCWIVGSAAKMGCVARFKRA